MAAERTFEAAVLLFNVSNPFLWFSAAMLGHHALEMLLKSALIRAGCSVREGGRPEDGFVWGHDLEKLATLLHSARPDFSGNIPPHPEVELISVSTYFARYNAIFNELRYPQASRNVDSLGPGEDEAELLANMMKVIRPFAFPLADEPLGNS